MISQRTFEPGRQTKLKAREMMKMKWNDGKHARVE